MRFLQKLHDRRSAPGLEWTIFRQLPWVALAGAVVPALGSLLLHSFPPEGSPDEVAKRLTLFDYQAIGLAITVWTGVLTAAIGCVVVIIMKGPAYKADGYHIPDRDRPAPHGEDGSGGDGSDDDRHP